MRAMQVVKTRDPEYGYPSLESTVELATESKCSYLEILHYRAVSSHETRVEHKTGSLNDDSLLAWLTNATVRSQGASATSTKESIPIGGLRVLMGSCTYNHTTQCSTSPFSARATELFATHLALPENFMTVLRAPVARAFKVSSLKSSSASTSYIFKFGIYRPSYYQLFLHHSPTKTLTTGILISKTFDHAFASLISSLLSPFTLPLTLHALLLPTLISGLVTTSACARIQTSNRDLNELEETLGMHEYANRPMGNPLELDFLSTTRALSSIGRAIQIEKMRVSALLLSLEMIRKEIGCLAKLNSIEFNIGDAVRTNVQEMVEAEMNLCRNLALRADAEMSRTQNQVSVVYQFMAQKDSKINIQLAKTSATIAIESKKDSAAMKAIAVLTMCFLPGTFLAALFTLPFFSWDGSKPTIKDGFGYYWLIALPLTLAVLLIWGLSVWLPWSKWLRTLLHHGKSEDVEAAEKDK